MMSKTAPTRSKTDHEYDTVSNWQKTGQARPKKPPRRFQNVPGRLQEGSKTPLGRVQDGLKPFRNGARFLSRFPDPEIISKNARETSKTRPERF